MENCKEIAYNLHDCLCKSGIDRSKNGDVFNVEVKAFCVNLFAGNTFKYSISWIEWKPSLFFECIYDCQLFVYLRARDTMMVPVLIIST